MCSKILQGVTASRWATYVFRLELGRNMRQFQGQQSFGRIGGLLPNQDGCLVVFCNPTLYRALQSYQCKSNLFHGVLQSLNGSR